MSYNSSFACIGALLALIGVLVIALYVILRFPNDRLFRGLRTGSGGGRAAVMLQSLVIVAALRDLVIWIPVLVIIAVLRWCGIGFNAYHKGPDKLDD